MPRLKVGNATLFDQSLMDHASLHDFDAIDDILDWIAIEKTLAPIYSSKEGGASYPPILMFRALLMQIWHNLSDVQAEKMLARDLLFRRFCRLSLMDPIPDHSTISRFRNKITALDLYDKLLAQINEQLTKKGAIIKEGEISILDATVIEAHQCRKKRGSSKKNPTENTQDGEAGWSVKTGTKGSKEFTYGFKAHANVDEDGFVKKLEVTAGNVHDSQMVEPILTGTEIEFYADSAYAGEPISKMLAARNIKNCVNKRAYRNKPLTKEDDDYNAQMSGVRYVVERTFGAFKRHYHGAKTRFLGVKKTKAWMMGIAIAHNLKKAAALLSLGVPLQVQPRGKCA